MDTSNDDPAAAKGTPSSSSMDTSNDEPAAARLAKDKTQANIKKRFQEFCGQLMNGCGLDTCSNPDCASNKDAVKRAKNQCVQRALQLVKSKGKLCKEQQEEKGAEVKAATPPEATVAKPVEAKESPPAKPAAPAHVPQPLSTQEVKALVESTKHDGFRGLIRRLGTFFTDQSSIGHSFLEQAHGKAVEVTEDWPSFEVEALHRVHELITEEPTVSNAFHGALQRLGKHLDSAPMPPACDLVTLRSFAVLLEVRSFLDPTYHDTFKLLIKRVTNLPAAARSILSTWMSTYSVARIDHLVGAIQQYTTVRWYTTRRLDDIMYAVRMLHIVHDANVIKEKQAQAAGGGGAGLALGYEAFYNDAVNSELDIKADFQRWRSPGPRFSFAAHPFILDPAAKARLLQYDAEVQMGRRVQEAVLASLFQRRMEPYLVLRIRRSHLLQDTLLQIQRKNSSDLKKPLKVKFEGEAGIDEGGVQKEFFQLLIAELFNPQFGMLTLHEGQRYMWFNKDSLESNMEFELMGILLGLAIYNSVILDITFPPVVYKKLMGEKIGMKDLECFMPELAKGLRQLLTFDGDVEAVFMRKFEVTYDVFGEEKTVELKEGGSQIALTNDNREEYVELYVNYVLNVSVSRQYTAFQRGFRDLCDSEPLKMFRSEELELLICGSPVLDFDALEASTRYEDGFEADSPVILLFWQVVHSLSLEDKKNFLGFCTGSDRAPIKGLGSLALTISKNGPDSDRLPTAHTCFNHLLLPEYSTKEKLEKALQTALANSKGFGLI